MIVVIPVYDEPDLISSLNSLGQCHAPNCTVGIIIVINASEKDAQSVKQRNIETHYLVQEWININKTNWLHGFVIMDNELPAKHAGVGLARKIGMDEAVRIFEDKNINGIIICFDADTLCQPNYFKAIEEHFAKNIDTPGCSIHFEHPIEGHHDKALYEGIMNYELHLRYYINALKLTGFPNAHQTIGSSMAVRSYAYQKQGGMNKRKAGEDFYFLNKIIALGNFTELKTTCVIPSPRTSHRVPFGTGKAVNDWINEIGQVGYSYAPETFTDLKQLISKISELYQVDAISYESFHQSMPQSIQTFLDHLKFFDVILQINLHSSTRTSFIKRFYLWFDSFRILKFVHHSRDNFHPNIPVSLACKWLLEMLKLKTDQSPGIKQQLQVLRDHDRHS